MKQIAERHNTLFTEQVAKADDGVRKTTVHMHGASGSISVQDRGHTHIYIQLQRDTVAKPTMSAERARARVENKMLVSCSQSV